MKTDFTIREAQQTDTIALKELFQNTVLAVNSKDYSQAEVEDWASCGDDLSNIEEMIKTHYFIVAVNQQSQIVGFSLGIPRVHIGMVLLCQYTVCFFDRRLISIFPDAEHLVIISL